MRDAAHGAGSLNQVHAWLRKKFSLPNEDDITKTFLSTQRTCAISRMEDLGLLRREKEGLRVKYLVTRLGEEFRNNSRKQTEGN